MPHDIQLHPETPLNISTTECIADIVSRQALHHPDAVAILTTSGSVSYGELETRSNRLARYLRSLGVGAETVIGLCMERSVGHIIGALAILKAGGAYLSLDPSNPTQRLVFMLSDAQVPIVITEEHLADKLASDRWRLVVVDGSDQNEMEKQSPLGLGTSADLDHLAYVIYTSGSTGVPKGVAISHRSLTNLVCWHLRTFDITSKDRGTYMSSLGFDACVWELWPYLAAGASVSVPDESIRNIPDLLRDWLVEQEVTVTFAPTPMAERLMGFSWPSPVALRLLLTGADTLHRFPLASLPFGVVNNYGPTECTVVATSGTVPTEASLTELPTIGRPIDNTRVYILDDKLERVPDGTPGEMFVAGTGVALGYLNHPELTAQRFIKDPFDPGSESRMYRTGDLARFLPDGQIAFMGRADDQVKVRGFRIELGEVAAALHQHPSVEHATVVARELPGGEKSLVAYCVQSPTAQPSESELKAWLRKCLPEYMVPSIFVKLDSLPLLPSGKIDRSSLPTPTAANTLRDESFVAPRTPIEDRTAEILAALLGIERVGVDDNFFMLGGHSLLGTQLIARLRDTFGVDLSLRTIFDAPTVAELSEKVEAQLVARVEAMSEEEVQRALGSHEGGFLQGA